MFTLVNLQRQLAMIWCCAKNHSSVTARCERFFAIFAVMQRVGSFWKRFKSVTSANSCKKHALRIGVALSWRCKLTSVTSPLWSSKAFCQSRAIPAVNLSLSKLRGSCTPKVCLALQILKKRKARKWLTMTNCGTPAWSTRLRNRKIF